MSGHTSDSVISDNSVVERGAHSASNVNFPFLMPSSPAKRTDASASKLKGAVFRINKVSASPLKSASLFSPHHLARKHHDDHNVNETTLSHFPTQLHRQERCRNGGQQKLSVELSRLCSSTFESDSDNSSCMFADESFLFSAESTEMADSVFDDEGGLDTSPEKSQVVAMLSEGSQKFCLSEAFHNHNFGQESAVLHGAAIAGSPTKRRSGKYSVRRVKSASSFRPSARYNPLGFSPRKLTRVREKWYKTRTDPCLYQRSQCSFEDFNHPNETKRVLHFQDVGQRELELPDCDKPHLIRTETPESGYGSLNSSQQTPEVTAAITPLLASVANSVTLNRAKTIAADTPVSLHQTLSIRHHSTPLLPFKRFDIIASLHEHESSLVNRILAFLEPRDLVEFSSVSSHWRSICSSDHHAAPIRDLYLEQRKRKNLGSNAQSGRHITGSGTPLAPVQHLGRPRAESTPVRPSSVFEKFEQVKLKLKKKHFGKSLRKCKCGSPARVDTNSSMAQCLSVHCQLEFCTKCQMGFHGNSPCPTASGSRRSRGPSVGSKKSKKNLRRHSRLSNGD
ncbi:uncharacterized protein [Diadema antillarum]|uniref:uncharacterized protein n=1 Tax=Diadema antillarum TaxID=105358 RepID=UPI003A8895BF